MAVFPIIKRQRMLCATMSLLGVVTRLELGDELVESHDAGA
jgi:hypothetical protein